MKALIALVVATLTLSACTAPTPMHKPAYHPTHNPSYTHNHEHRPQTNHTMHNHSMHNQAMHNTQRPQAAKTFACNDIGLDVRVEYLDADRIALSVVNDPTAQPEILNRMRSASGALFGTRTGLWGHGATWHEKNNYAMFEYGQISGQRAEVSCTAI